MIPPAIALSIVGISLALAASFFDMSWDGLWYHQTAVYQMSHGWNPIYDPLHDFVPHLQDWLRHYAKGPWYVALALFETTGNIEMAKAAPWIALAAAFCAVLAACVDTGMRRRTAVLIAAVVSMNPVVMFELASYLVDGLMISFLACFVAALIRWFRRPGLLVTVVMVTSAVLCINAKFTGLVYLSFVCAAAGLYALARRREILARYAIVQGMSILVGVLLFGFNPYMTNTIYRGNPFYPMLGSAAYPSLSERGEDPIEKYETPGNMVGRNRFVRLGYAIFGRPGAQPYFVGTDAGIMWPFDVGWKDFSMYYFHDVRISGFGPLFSGVLLISLCVFVVALFRPGISPIIVVLSAGTIIVSLLVSVHTWWARYGPQLWWLPIVAIIAGLAVSGSRVIRWITYGLIVVLLVNVVLVTIVHFRWEVDATRTTHEQLSWLRGKTDIQVDLQYFGEPFSERLHTAGVQFIPVQHLQCPSPVELMSVSPGYPCAVRACITQ